MVAVVVAALSLAALFRAIGRDFPARRSDAGMAMLMLACSPGGLPPERADRSQASEAGL
jgi:hypothetical protein